MNNKFFRYLTVGVLVTMIVGVFALAFPGGTVFAQTTQPEKPRPQANPEGLAKMSDRLEKAYQAELRRLARQEEHLDKAAGFVTRVQEIIARMQAKGADTSKIQAALADFRVKVAEARTLHGVAKRILNNHQGFNDAGKVTNPQQARETLREAAKAMNAAAKSLQEGRKHVIQLIQQWRQQHQPKPGV